MNKLEKLANVYYGEKYSKQGQAQVPLRMAPKLHDIMWTLATTNPNWKFYIHRAIDLTNHTNEPQLKVEAFQVFIDNHDVGTIWDVRYRGEQCIGVANRRIGKTLNRGEMTRTSDVSKALQHVKKYFGKKTANELLHEASREATDRLNTAVWTRQRKVRDIRNGKIENHVSSFIYRDGVDTFRAYLAAQSDGSSLVEAYNESFELADDLRVVSKIHDAHEQKKACVIIVDDGKYIVYYQQTKDVKIYDDADMPMHLRGKIGLLKLVQVGAVVGDTGCRVKDNMFVTLNDTESTTC